MNKTYIVQNAEGANESRRQTEPPTMSYASQLQRHIFPIENRFSYLEVCAGMSRPEEICPSNLEGSDNSTFDRFHRISESTEVSREATFSQIGELSRVRKCTCITSASFLFYSEVFLDLPLFIPIWISKRCSHSRIRPPSHSSIRAQDQQLLLSSSPPAAASAPGSTPRHKASDPRAKKRSASSPPHCRGRPDFGCPADLRCADPSLVSFPPLDVNWDMSFELRTQSRRATFCGPGDAERGWQGRGGRDEGAALAETARPGHAGGEQVPRC
jgi:hypothetical protein